jgi:hypothetical protein
VIDIDSRLKRRAIRNRDLTNGARFIAKQLSRPSGFIGVAIRYLMNRRNARINVFAVQ